MLARWSARRADITARHGQLTTAFQADHGRPPTPVESIKLAQQATVETRRPSTPRGPWPSNAPRGPPKPARSWAATRAGWPGCSTPSCTPRPPPEPVGGRDRRRPVGSRWGGSQAAADRVVEQVQARRATWRIWHVRAEAWRQVRPLALAPGRAEKVVEDLVGHVLERAVRGADPSRGRRRPNRPVLRRRDGTSVYEVAGTARYTSAAILAAEARLVAAAARRDGR